MEHIHKRFTGEQVQVLLKGYCQVDKNGRQQSNGVGIGGEAWQSYPDK